MITDNKTLMVGAACVPMGYPKEFFPYTGFRGRYLTGVKDDLCVRAVYLSEDEQEMLFLSLELGDVGNEWLAELAKRTEIPAHHIYMTATHTHSAPHVGGHWPEDVVDVAKGEEFSRMCWDSVLSAAEKAKAARRPAVMRCGRGSCGININRDYPYSGDDGSITSPYIQAPNPKGVSDKTIYILSFDTLDGQPIACIFSYAVHSNVTFHQTWGEKEGMLITGDIAGVAMRYIEQRTGAVAVFCLGAAADQSPLFLGNHRVFDRGRNAAWEYYGPEGSYALMDAQGTFLGEAVLDALAQLRSAEGGKIAAVTTSVTLECKLDGHRKTVGETGKDDSYIAQYKEKMDDDFSYIAGGTLEMPLYLTRIHDVNIIGIPAEIVTSIGQKLRESVTEILGGETVVITQCNDAYSYIADDDGYEERTFEALASHVMPGSCSRIIEAVRRAAEELK